MSIDYSTYLVYGRVINPHHEDVLQKLADELGDNYVRTPRDVFLYNVEEKLRAKYPLLGSLVNNDQVSGSLPNALVVYAKSSLVDLSLQESGDLYKLSPLRVNAQGVDSQEIAQLKKFCDDYSLREHLDWTIVAWIS